MTSYPSPAEVDAIAGHPDPVARNLRITQAYYELSTAVAALDGLATNCFEAQVAKVHHADPVGTYPAHLQSPANADLAALLGSIDPDPGSPLGSGVEDWASLADRMHYIGELFRLRQEDAGLLGAPFTPDQTAAIKEGRPPSGPALAASQARSGNPVMDLGLGGA